MLPKNYVFGTVQIKSVIHYFPDDPCLYREWVRYHKVGSFNHYWCLEPFFARVARREMGMVEYWREIRNIIDVDDVLDELCMLKECVPVLEKMDFIIDSESN